jgi:hypothetical protein
MKLLRYLPSVIQFVLSLKRSFNNNIDFGTGSGAMAVFRISGMVPSCPATNVEGSYEVLNKGSYT